MGLFRFNLYRDLLLKFLDAVIGLVVLLLVNFRDLHGVGSGENLPGWDLHLSVHRPQWRQPGDPSYQTS